MKLYPAFHFFMQYLEKACCIIAACVAIAGFAFFGLYLAGELLAMWTQ